MKGTVCLLFSVLVTACLARSRFHYENGKTVEETLRTVTRFGQNELTKTKPGRGHAKNCGPKASHLKASWVPEPIIEGEGGKMDINISLVAVTNLSKLAFDIGVYFGNGTGGIPVFNFTVTKNCSEAIEWFPDLKCPVTKGGTSRTCRSTIVKMLLLSLLLRGRLLPVMM